MVVYFLLGLLTGWTTFFCMLLILAYKTDQSNKKQYQDMITNLYNTYQDHINLEDLRKFKS
jgi:hypothetical protein